MKKVVLASLLAVAGAVPLASPMFSQAPATGGGIQMSQAEYAAYNKCATATTTKAADCEAYLKAYPNSAVKEEVLNDILFADSQAGDQTATLDVADRLLAIDPNNLRALTFEVYYRRADADKLTDPAAKQAALDKVATFAQQGLNAAKPKDVSEADFTKLKAATAPTFLSAVADDDLAKKDNAAAITELKKEISDDPADTEKASAVLQDVYVLAQAYYTSTPPDYLNCAWYATRAAAFAPAAYKSTIQPLATYCYDKYHGGADGYQLMQTAVQTDLNPPPVCPKPAAGAAPAAAATPAAGATPAAAPAAAPAGCLAVTPALKPEDVIANLLATTPDLAALAISDREFVIEYGKPEDADKVFDAVKGKSVELPGVTVISATPDMLTVAVSADAVQSKTADFTFNMKEPIRDRDLPTVGSTVTLDGTYASYTQKPLMITMSDGALVLPKRATPVHHTHHATGY